MCKNGLWYQTEYLPAGQSDPQHVVNSADSQAAPKIVLSNPTQQGDSPEIAEKLIPKDHGFGTRRVPMETGYYEVYNQDNVLLVDLNETPIEAITAQGIKTTQDHYDFDLVIYATGFDAVMGPFNSIDFVGSNGKQLREKWESGPRTYLGLQTTADGSKREREGRDEERKRY
jgi:hypothetical protein